jgi:hypothetical protein
MASTPATYWWRHVVSKELEKVTSHVFSKKLNVFEGSRDSSKANRKNRANELAPAQIGSQVR